MTAAWTWFCSIAATEVAPLPMPTTATLLGSMPFLRRRYLRKKSVEEPGALTPTVLPTRSAMVFTDALLLGDTIRTSPGSLSKMTIDCIGLFFAAHPTGWSEKTQQNTAPRPEHGGA